MGQPDWIAKLENADNGTAPLTHFVAVAKVLSFTRAAERLHLAQPSLTRQIKDLEAEIGVQLFDRVRKRTSLTPEGESFLLDARRLLAECAQSVQAVQRLSRGEASQLNIGYVANIYHDLVKNAQRSKTVKVWSPSA